MPASGPAVTSYIFSADIVDGELYAADTTGIVRRPGMLPIAADTTTATVPVIGSSGVTDFAFVDTDAVAGVDTVYIARGTRGLYKYALSGGSWQARGRVAGSFAWVAARALAGKVEIYATDNLNTKVQKVVDTAETGATVASTGAETIAYAPTGVRYAGLAFEPGTGLPADATPYPAVVPRITTSATTVDTNLGAATKGGVTIEVSDANTPASDLTVTAASSGPASLPADKVAIAGTGTRRTVTFDPIAAGAADDHAHGQGAGRPDGQRTVSVRTTGARGRPGRVLLLRRGRPVGGSRRR